MHVQDGWLQTTVGPTVPYIYKALTMDILKVNSIYPPFSGRVQHVPLDHKVTHSNEYICNDVMDFQDYYLNLQGT